MPSGPNLPTPSFQNRLQVKHEDGEQVSSRSSDHSSSTTTTTTDQPLTLDQIKQKLEHMSLAYKQYGQSPYIEPPIDYPIDNDNLQKEQPAVIHVPQPRSRTATEGSSLQTCRYLAGAD